METHEKISLFISIAKLGWLIYLIVNYGKGTIIDIPLWSILVLFI